MSHNFMYYASTKVFLEDCYKIIAYIERTI